MDPVTKADLKDLFKELRAEWKEDIKSSVAAEFESWRPKIDSQIADLQEAVGLLQKQHTDDKGKDAGEASARDQPGGPYITTSYDYEAPLDEYGM
ncbi:hypothetical protein ZWY2020_055595 [Hordeum vulgare]|nr:hypothetical protein ZWY2020_055595 [Hordeum vulgare]